MNTKQIEDIYPLSPMQQGMLFHSLYAPTSGVYIIQVSFEIHGCLNVAAFEQAWQVVIDRHTVVRTAFVWEVEQPLQIVGRRIKPPFTLVDWHSIGLATQKQQLDAFLQAQRQQGFNLAKAPLMHLALIHKQPQVYQFIWSYHHLLLDGWSVPLVLQDVLTCYNAFSLGQSLHLEKPRPYRDYIAWLRKQDLSQSEQFWRRNLAGFTVPTPFRVDKRLEPGIRPNTNNQEQEIRLQAEITTKLQTFAKHHQLTLNTLIQGAFALLLSRYSGEEEVMFGVTCSGRPATLSSSESMVGLFINTLPMRVQVDAKQLLLPWLQQLQKQQVEIRQYEYSPLFEIQRWSDINRGLPLFESLIVFENYPIEPTLKSALTDLNLQNIRTIEQNNYPLALYVVVDSALSLRILYDDIRFEATTITRMLGHLQTLLFAMVVDQQRSLSELPLLTAAEQQQILVWNNTHKAFSDTVCVHQLFEVQVERTPDAVAVVFEDQQITYRELNNRANQLAHYLQALGVRKETRVGICLERSIDMLVCLLSILKAGGTYIPIDPAYPQERKAFMLEDAQVEVLLKSFVETDNSQFSTPHFEFLIPICIDTDWNAIAQHSPDNLPPQTTPDNLAYIIYTSGSTGQPKGVQILHKALVNFLESMRQTPGLSRDDVLMAVTTLSFDIAALELYLPLIVGARLIIVSRDIVQNGIQLAQYLANSGVSIMQATPATWKLLLAAGWQGSTQLKILCGGEALDGKLAQQLLERSLLVWNLYGPTETTIWSSVYQVEFGMRNAEQRNSAAPIENSEFLIPTNPIPIGRPIANTQFYVLDDYLQQLPVGVPGQLYIGGASLARGYLNRPKLTADKFIPNPFTNSKLGIQNSENDQSNQFRRTTNDFLTLYKTGDLVRYRPDGTLEYLGRIDDQVKLRGFRIELGEIEAALMQHSDVQQAVVTLYKDQQDERLVAYVVLQPNTAQSPALTIPTSEFRHFLEARLPAYMLPSAYVMLEKLPLTPNGKIDRKALPTPGGTRPDLEINYVMPRTKVEQMIAQIWQQVLQVEKIGIHDNFFDLGGHSLLMVKVHSQLREQFASNISLVEMFRYPTISALTAYFNRAGDNSDLSQFVDSRNEQVAAGKERLRQRLQQRTEVKSLRSNS